MRVGIRMQMRSGFEGVGAASGIVLPESTLKIHCGVTIVRSRNKTRIPLSPLRFLATVLVS